eukprot:TRINITY_DN531_c0_g1_i1.p1 TRINITY_DN531_c0_g1~~TRINITY_DN531_c0_g1_i1.p1  ORF type:complete len:397 (-),score=127.51 TRINITY_DN531_c0_g1_i1:45-1235(-)
MAADLKAPIYSSASSPSSGGTIDNTRSTTVDRFGQESSSPNMFPAIVGGAAGGVILVIIIAVVIVILVFRRKKKPQDDVEMMALNSLRLENVTVQHKLGEGNFGAVYHGLWNETPVALKKLTQAEAFDEFAKEAALLAKLGHPNIVRFLGLFTSPETGERFIVTDFMSGGSLTSYLTRIGDTLSLEKRLSMAIGAAQGMAYLEGKKIIHRDLACRNILVNGEGSVVVSDFGLSRSDVDFYSPSNGKIAVKWAAEEVLKGQACTGASDVWSYGVVCWEILMNGILPFGYLSNKEVCELVPKGERLARPEICPDEWWNLMLRCWSSKPEDRPLFLEIVRELKLLRVKLFPHTKDDDLDDLAKNVDYANPTQESTYAFTPSESKYQSPHVVPSLYASSK